MHRKQRVIYAGIFAVLLLTEVTIALFVRDRFVRPYVGDVLVTLLMCCFCGVCIPRKATAITVGVFLFAAAVELGQYFDIVKQMGLENNKLVSTLLGRTFSLADIICYAVGCLLFFLINIVICKVLVKKGGECIG